MQNKYIWHFFVFANSFEIEYSFGVDKLRKTKFWPHQYVRVVNIQWKNGKCYRVLDIISLSRKKGK